MSVIEGDELKPCKEMFTRKDKDGRHVNLMTRCSYPMCEQGCFNGKGNCKDYVLAKRRTKEIRNIASQIEKSN